MEQFKDVWFVDDDESFRFIIKRLIEKSDFTDRADFFDDGDRAMMKMVELSKSGHRFPSIIFLDLMMTHIDGWQLVDLLNELELKVNVVILSSKLELSDAERAGQEPLVKGCLSKPIKLPQIEEYVRELDQAASTN